jgi:hypothetical protein
MGVVVFAVIGLYLLISIGIVKVAIAYARKNGKRVWPFGFSAALVMYLIPFWDLLPTVVAEKYYCATESGFFQYKTIDQWKEQNPRVIDTLSIAHLPERYLVAESKPTNVRKYRLPDGTSLHAYFDVRNSLMFVEYKKTDGESGLQLNERLREAYKYDEPGLLKVARSEYILVDIGTDEVLARQVDFRQATKNTIRNSFEESGWKFWFQSYGTCVKSHPQNFPNGGIREYVRSWDKDCPGKRAEETERDGIKIACPWRP